MYNSPAIERLDIKEYNWWNECLHGVARAGKATVFPQAIGLAATFDTALVFQVADVISTEARAKHQAALKKDNTGQYSGLTFWTPNINIFRDPRWGRGQETYGEDPLLTSWMGTSFVRGLQGNDPKHLKTAACAKHFIVHSGPEAGRHHFNALPTEADFYNTYAPAFKALVEAGVESVMCAYNRTWDEPCCGSTPLLNDLLRTQWGFKGQVVSDCWALDDMWLRHQVVETEVEAAALGAKAGTNLNCGSIYHFLPEAVAEGLITEETIDSLLQPVLLTRFKLGMFDPDSLSPWFGLNTDTVNCLHHQELAYQVALESCVLLQNKNHILPLDESSLNNIFITGPTAAEVDALLGNYNGFSGNLSTMLEGVIDHLDPGTMADYSRGCLLSGDSVYHGFWQAGFADVVLAFMGNTRLVEGEDGDAMLSNHGGDRIELGLPANQIEFLQLMREHHPDKPIVVVIAGGSAIDVSAIKPLVDGILMAWYPGEQGGKAVADLIFGDASPSGKLPVTFYKSVDDLPDYEDYSMNNRTYRYFTGEALYPFGYGLSYASFDFLGAEVDRSVYKDNEKIHLTVSVKNTSKIKGAEVVQVYCDYPVEGEGIPLQTLVAFARIDIEPGSTKLVELDIPVDRFQLWESTLGKGDGTNEQQSHISNGDYRVHMGNYHLRIGASSQDIRLTQSIEVK
jgi:beta-glucosidase